MNYLIDTHIFLWAVLAPTKIPKHITKILLDQESTKYVSAISFWEISLKFQLGKLDLEGIFPKSLPQISKEAGFNSINLDPEVASTFYMLPIIKNKDPFDRMLAWQAIQNDYFFLTSDPSFSDFTKYGLKSAHQNLTKSKV